ncbi:hypothetical protein BGX28_006116 [Mortierella sp. GBA30]|nr:hypothetical protein BGX28_006116 [Mortierella sp. GBA30]
MAPVKTRSTSSRHRHNRGYKADPDDTNDDEDFYGMRELKHQLAGMNLQLKDTMGDGNCLFRACADQYTGNEREHSALRAEVCGYVEDHAEHFKSFLDNETVEAHVAKMRKNGTYGGNIELVAFARMKRVDIKVYQPGYIFVIEGVDVKKEGSSPGQRPIMHIAYHSWEHYSSIRNIDGPHEGPPEINPRPMKQAPLAKLTSQDPPRSIERMIMKASGVRDLELVRELLEKYRGDTASVYSDLAEKSSSYHSDAELTDDTVEQNATTEENLSDHSPKDNDDQSSKEKEQKERKDKDKDKDGIKTLSNLDNEDSSLSFRRSASFDQLCPRYDQTDENPSLPGSPRPPLQVPTPVSAASASQANSPGASPDSGNNARDQRVPSPPVEATKGIIPKKRISKEKKELAKRNQKINRKNKGKNHHISSQPGDQSSSSGSDRNSPTDLPAGASPGRMRELFV